MRIRRTGKSSSPPSRKSFSAIPRSFSKAIDKRRFTKEVLGDFFGGEIKSSLNPLKRKDVRSILEEAGVLGMLDPTAKGARSTHASKLTDKEAIDILKKTRDTLRQNLKEKGWGVHEGGKFRSNDPKSIYRKVIEKGFHDENGQTSVEQLHEAEQIRVERARRREIARQELGLSSLKKLAQEKSSRREDLEQRLESMRKPQTTAQPKASAQTGASAATPSATPQKSTGRGLGMPRIIPSVHVPGTGISEDADEPDEPKTIAPAQPASETGSDPGLAAADDKKEETDEDESQKPDRRIDENLPL